MGFDRWLAELEKRHLGSLRVPEVTRALRALSSAYVERRHTVARGGPLDGAGKRAAFALFYGPLHYLLVAAVVRELSGALAPVRTLVDLGCGTGAAGAAWAAALTPPPAVVGIDRHPWAVAESARTYREFGLTARSARGHATDPLPGSPRAVLAAFTVNELDAAARDGLLSQLLDRRRPGDRVLIVEPIARTITPWWNGWRDAFAAAGGRADEWRIPVTLPPLVAKLDQAAGLRHRELTARTLWL